ncbi:MAG: methanogenesis marker 6 protein [Methanomicrobiales archaeon]|nr:methanogenesis marker 6 protein [Methanomicrobiales archaeon]
MKEYIPKYAGTVTKYVFVESPSTRPEELAQRAYEVSEGAMIKETCFGLQVTGRPNEVARIIGELRKLDPNHIFVKDRGFPPGDPRRCRANLGGARPGYHGHEFEIALLPNISHGLEAIESGKKEIVPSPVTRIPEKLDVQRLKMMMDAQEP